MKMAVAGTGYVGLLFAVRLSLHNGVTTVDVAPEKGALLNSWRSTV